VIDGIVSLCVLMSVVRDLGMFFDAELAMRDHHNSCLIVRQTRFFHLRRLHSVRWRHGQSVTAKLLKALLLSRLHHSNNWHLRK